MDSPDKKKIVISPVTRIEGHAKITLQLNDAGDVEDAHFHVNEFRGFEKFCEGRMYTEMPVITPRICGICPVSHSIASVKACEMIQGIQPTYTGNLLRRMLQAGQQISSHALSFFHLSAPDFLLGYHSDPSQRNLLGIAEKFPEIALKGIRLRKFGQEISERITGKKIHSNGITPGGLLYSLTEENRNALKAWIPEALDTAFMGLKILKKFMDENKTPIEHFATSPSLYMGLVNEKGCHELYEGKIRLIDENGLQLEEQFPPDKYLNIIAERAVSWSYLKYPYYKPLGAEKGIYRVGPLARLNVASSMKTPLAQEEFLHFKSINNGKPVHGTFYYHYARLIELLASIEEVQTLLEDPECTSLQVHHQGKWNYNKGVGCSEAPRGILFHDYQTDNTGKLQKVNLLIATGQNNPSMNRSVLDVAKLLIHKGQVNEGLLNRIESSIRCYDPCLSCSTHAIGQMPLVIELLLSNGNLWKSLQSSLV